MNCCLQLKTSYSLLSSLCDIKQLVNKAKQLRYSSLAITDKNNMHGVMLFYNECLNNDIKPIIGLELDIDEGFLLLYAMNYQGYVNLCKLVTIKSERDITNKDLHNYKDNLICILPFFLREKKIEYEKIYKHLYFGYKDTFERQQLEDNKRVLITDVLYLENNAYKYLNYIYMIRDMKKESEANYFDLKNHHLLSTEEISELSSIDDIKNSKEISDLCNLEFVKQDKLLPIYDDKIDSNQYLTSLCRKGLAKRLNNNISSAYVDRLNYELDMINKMGFTNYFLVVWDFVKFAKRNNILVGPGRGSSAGSLVAYTLGITDVNPLAYDLVFERFLNPERITMPDIDLDFDAYKRDEVIKYVTHKYGSKRVAQIITFGTMAAKQVIRDVGRCLDINLNLVDKVASLIRSDLSDSYKQSSRLRELINSSDILKKLYDISLHLEGLPRHTSIHAAGVIMSNVDLNDVIPLLKQDQSGYLTGYSMEYLETLGLLKVDFLGLKNLTLIDNIITNLKNDGFEVNFNNIPLNDKQAIKLFHDVNTVGIFQFESTGMKNFLRKLKITSFDDVVASIALFRPGPMDNIDTYIKRKYHQEAVKYIHEDLKPILNTTYGIIIYQEQIMEIAKTIAGFSLGEADVLRRAMSKKKEEILLKQREKFINQSISRGYKQAVAEQIYELILKFANYGFPKAHAVAYSMIGYKMAYLKAHYPKYFITSLLNNVIGSDLKTKEYISEAKCNQIIVLLPDINKSNFDYTINNEGIIYPLTNIRNVGYNVAAEIINERKKGNYQDFIDFVARCYNRSVNRKVIASLIDGGCFNNFGYNKQTLHHNLEAIINYAEVVSDVGSDYVLKPVVEEVLEFDKLELLAREKEVFGFYLSMHPTSQYKNDTDIQLADLDNYFDKLINTIVFIDYIKEIKTKEGLSMAFIEGSDDTGSGDFTVFPKIYEKHSDLKKGNIVRIKGRVEKRFDKYQIIVQVMDKI